MGFLRGVGSQCVDCCDAIRSFKGVTIPCVELSSRDCPGGWDRDSSEYELSVEPTCAHLPIQVTSADHF